MSRPLKLFSLFLCLFLATLLTACQNGPIPSTVQSTGCPLKIQPKLTVLASEQTSSQTMYVTSGPNLYAFDAGSGTTRWCNTTAGINQADQFYSLGHDGGNVYAATSTGKIAAFNSATGALGWHIDTGASQMDDKHISPVIVNHVIYAGFQEIQAFSERDGRVLWQYPLADQSGVNAPPVVMDKLLYFSAESFDDITSQIYALDAATGKQRWTMPLDGGETTLFAADGTLFFSNGDPMSSQSLVGAINAETGKLLWQKPFSIQSSDSTFTPLNATNGTLYVLGTPLPQGKTGLYALNSQTGATLWSSSTNAQDIGEQLLVTTTSIYLADSLGNLAALKPGTGKLIWKAQLKVSGSVLPGQLILLDNHHLFVSTASLESTKNTFLLHAFNLTTQQEDWYIDISAYTSGESVTCLSS